MALVVQRNRKQSIIIQNKHDATQVRIIVNKITPNRVELHVEAPQSYRIIREEAIK